MFCKICHQDVANPESIQSCECRKKLEAMSEFLDVAFSAASVVAAILLVCYCRAFYVCTCCHVIGNIKTLCEYLDTIAIGGNNINAIFTAVA